MLAIFAHDDGLPYYIEEEREFYRDGTKKLLLIDRAYITVENEAFELDKFIQCIQNGEEYDGPGMMEEDWDRFFELDKLRCGKEMYIPSNILNYANAQYIQETPQVEAMRRFLLQEIELNIDCEFVKSIAAMEPDERKIREKVVKETLLKLHNLICDVLDNPGEVWKISEEILRKDGYSLKKKHMLRFQELYVDMSNHTRMPANCGFTPEEMLEKTKNIPRGFSFSENAVKMLQI